VTLSPASIVDENQDRAVARAEAEETPRVTVRRLEKAYNPVRKALDGVDFELRSGFTGLLGPNGAGKSTLMSCLAGILSWDAGQIFINGIDAERHPARCRRDVGFMPERVDFPREMRVQHYLEFVAATAKRLPRGQRRGAVQTALERAGLGPVRSRVVGNLSKGYRQRVGLAQALIGDPAFVILDEPTAGLDPLNLLEIRPTLVEYAADHVVLLSTHTLAEARLLCDRLLVLRSGALIYNGPTSGLGAGGTRQMRLRVAGYDNRDLESAVVGLGATLVRFLSSREVVVELADDDEAADLTSRLAAQGWRVAALEATSDVLEDAFRNAVTGDTTRPDELTEVRP
jgi:ABC-2 type transport system ATP-binding protein